MALKRNCSLYHVMNREDGDYEEEDVIGNEYSLMELWNL